MTMVENEAQRRLLLAQLEQELARPAPDLPDHTAAPCLHWDHKRRQYCELQPTRRYLIGNRCDQHAPSHPFGYRGGS